MTSAETAGGSAGPPRARRNIHTLPAGQDFLPVLARAILQDRLGLGVGGADPASLASLTVYLPTRRAARALAAILLKESGSRSLILPRLVPLGDPGEAEIQDILSRPPAEAGLAEEGLAEGPAPINPLARQVLLALQIQKASRAHEARLKEAGEDPRSLSASSLGAAFGLGGDLAAILDAMQAEDVPYERMLGLDAGRFDALWQLTARFLAIFAEVWPKLLEDRGEVDPVIWRNRLLDRQGIRLAEAAAEGRAPPVLVAGSTGSMPATARLIATVAGLPRGAVVLPDLDLGCGAADWASLTARPKGQSDLSVDRAASHPQAQLARLLKTMGADRAEVKTLIEGPEDAPRLLRRKLAHEALRAAAGAEAWRDLDERMPHGVIETALAEVKLLEAPDERMEGLAIALAIREALETPGRTVAVATPDRGLAERIALELGRWNVEVDDSAGQPLARTLAGHALSLLLTVLQTGARSQSLIEFLHHPHIRLGLGAERLRRARQALEIGALRGVRVFEGLDALRAAVGAVPGRVADRRAPGPRGRLSEDDVEAAKDLAERLIAALEPLMAHGKAASTDLSACIACLRDALEALSRTEEGDVAAFRGEDGRALQILLDDLEEACRGLPGTIDDLVRVGRLIMGERVARVRRREHPRVMLLGLLEARLMSADLVILGGLNEGAWPPLAGTDVFLNRSMRAELGLSSPERRIGQSAHDFIEAFSGGEVILSRALKVGGVPSLPSRFWQRLQAVTPEPLWKAAQARGADYADIAARLDQPETVSPWRRPKPCPPAHLQPAAYSVTEVETLYRDPYAIYARRILELAPLEPAQVALGASDRGQLLHEVMQRFVEAHPVQLPPDPLSALIAQGRATFAPLMGEPDVEAFWWPRFQQLAPRIVEWERERRQGAARIGAELRVSCAFRLEDGAEVTLHARADRVEVRTDGRLAILDFKSGAPPSAAQVKAGLAPQLPLEAALASRAAYKPVKGPGEPIGRGEVAEAAYVQLRPGQDALKASQVAPPGELGPLAEEHLEGFRAVAADLRAGRRSFTSRFAAQFMRFDGDYDHLARVKEWSAAGHDSDEDPS
jgi:ATP-dependent helicase/nuclease subunit B